MFWYAKDKSDLLAIISEMLISVYATKAPENFQVRKLV